MHNPSLSQLAFIGAAVLFGAALLYWATGVVINYLDGRQERARAARAAAERQQTRADLRVVTNITGLGSNNVIKFPGSNNTRPAA